MKRQSLILFAILAVSIISCSESVEKDYKDASLSIDERVEALFPKLSLEEKVAQMRIFHANIGART